MSTLPFGALIDSTPEANHKPRPISEFQDLVSTLTRQLECNICCDIILDPYALECGHAFCRECLYATFRAQQNAHTYSYNTGRAVPTCPHCRAAIDRAPTRCHHLRGLVDELCTTLTSFCSGARTEEDELAKTAFDYTWCSLFVEEGAEPAKTPSTSRTPLRLTSALLDSLQTQSSPARGQTPFSLTSPPASAPRVARRLRSHEAHKGQIRASLSHDYHCCYYYRSPAEKVIQFHKALAFLERYVPKTSREERMMLRIRESMQKECLNPFVDDSKHDYELSARVGGSWRAGSRREYMIEASSR